MKTENGKLVWHAGKLIKYTIKKKKQKQIYFERKLKDEKYVNWIIEHAHCETMILSWFVYKIHSTVYNADESNSKFWKEKEKTKQIC